VEEDVEVMKIAACSTQNQYFLHGCPH
jgi:hypothetical protein